MFNLRKSMIKLRKFFMLEDTEYHWFSLHSLYYIHFCKCYMANSLCFLCLVCVLSSNGQCLVLAWQQSLWTFQNEKRNLRFSRSPASILYKSTAGRYRSVSYPDGPITARYRLIKNAYWDMCHLMRLCLLEVTDTDLVRGHGRFKCNLYLRWFSTFIFKATNQNV